MALSFTTAIDRIEALYVGYFGRAGDPVGTNYWIDRLNAGMTYNQIAASFAVQTESTSKYPFLAAPNVADAGAFVDQVFVNMFGHVADTAGKAYWVAQVTARLGNTAAIGNMILDVISGAQSTDITIMQNKVNVGTFFTQTLANAGASYSASADALSKSEIAATTADPATVTTQKAATTTFTTTGGTGATLSLTPTIGEVINGTTGNDAINGNLLFNAPSGTFIQTVQTGDSVNAGTGNDTFTIQTNTAAAVVLSAMTGVENLVLQPVGAAMALNLVNGDNATVQITTNNDGGNATTVTNINGLVGTLNLTNVSGVQTYTTTASVLAGATDAIVVNLNGVTAGSSLTLGVTGTGTNGFETVTFNSSGSVTNTLAGGFTATGATTENFNGATAMTIADGVATVRTVNAGGTGGVGGMTAALTWTAGAGSGQQNITGGTAGDTFNMAGTWTTTDVINGGAGTDTVTSTIANLVAVTAATNANVTLVETIGATNALDGTTVNLSNIVGLTGFNVAGGTAATALETLNYATGTNNLNLSNSTDGGNGLTVNIAGTATSDVLNITAGSATAGAGSTMGGTFTSNGAETINLNAVGGASTFAAFTMTNTPSTESLIITGAQAVTFGGAVTAEVVNGSAMTGILSVAGSASASGVILSGGSAADVLTGSGTNDVINGNAGADLINGGGGADTITAGTGNDTVRIASTAESQGAGYAATNTTSANIDKILDFVGNGNAAGDTIQLATTANAYDATGAALTFTGATVANVTTVSVTTASTLTTLAAALNQATVSTNATAQIADVTVAAGTLAGRYMVIYDTVAGVTFAAATDTIIDITGITGALHAQDITFV